MAKKLGGFALNGEGLGSGAMRGNVAFGGRAGPDDGKMHTEFSSGRLAGKNSDTTPRLDQAPARTVASRRGVSGTGLPLGKQESGSGVTDMALKSASRGAKSGELPLGKPDLKQGPAKSLKYEK